MSPDCANTSWNGEVFRHRGKSLCWELEASALGSWLHAEASETHISGPGRGPASRLPWWYVSITSVRVKRFSTIGWDAVFFHSSFPSILTYELSSITMAIDILRSGYRKWEWRIDSFGGGGGYVTCSCAPLSLAFMVKVLPASWCRNDFRKHKCTCRVGEPKAVGWKCKASGSAGKGTYPEASAPAAVGGELRNVRSRKLVCRKFFWASDMYTSKWRFWFSSTQSPLGSSVLSGTPTNEAHT